MAKLETKNWTPFDHDRLYGQEKYCLNGMVMQLERLPLQMTKEDKCLDIWTDRLGNEGWKAMTEGINSHYTGDAWLAGASPLIKLGENLCKFLKYDMPVTGVGIIRYTDAGQYPCYHIMVANNVTGQPTTSGNGYEFGEEFIQERDRYFRKQFGMEYDFYDMSGLV